ncbi:MAG: VWA domain-containing protein [Gammaproteobacteria bacterium]|nr:MAG: VWA domain-containing protein [Gammaproteobacteria bacterium]
MVEAFHFIRPYMLLLLVPALVVTTFLFLRKKSHNSWSQICDSHLLRHLSVETGQSKARISLSLLLFAWIVAAIALSGPAWRQAQPPAFRNQRALVVVLDMSYSMLAQDIKPSRAERAKFKVLDLLERNSAGQTSLIVFAGDAHAVTPLTDDINTIKLQTEPLSPMIMPFPGSRPDQGVFKALELLKNGAANKGEIILLTDGTEGYWKQLQDVAADVNAAGHMLSIIGVGTEDGAPIPAAEGGFVQDRSGAIVLPKLEESRLQQIVREGVGKYVTISADDSDIDSIDSFNTHKKQINKDKKQQVATSWSDDGYWLLFLLLPFVLYCFRRGVIFVVPLAYIITPEVSYATDLWDKLWLNQQQVGIQQFKDGQYEKALANLQGNSLWQAVAKYKAGKFEDALKSLQGNESSLADYNRGNALAQLGRYHEAVAAYAKAFEKDPDNADARHNKELIEKYLQQQEGEQQEQNQQQQDDKQGDGQRQDQQQGQQSQSQQGEQSQQEQNQSENQNQQSQSDQHKEQQAQQGDLHNKPEKESEQARKMREQLEREEQEQREQKGKGQPQMAHKEDDQRQSKIDQKTEQWLRQIPDNPGGLLKRKFLYESRKRYQKGTLPDTGNEW